MKIFYKFIIIFITFLFFSCKQAPTDEWILINDIESEIEVTINGKTFHISAKSHIFVSFDQKPSVSVSENLHADYTFGSYYKDKSYNMIKFTPQPCYNYVIKNQIDVPISVIDKNNKDALLATLEPETQAFVTVYKNPPVFSFINENFSFPYLESYSEGICYITVYQ